jgi:(2Fe-2S) ferredoxin
MSKHDFPTASEFAFEGRFLSFVVKDGYKVKALRMATAHGEHYIKLSKEARVSIGRPLTPGEWILATGRQKRDDGEIKFKAYSISRISPTLQHEESQPKPLERSVTQTILICQKSDCCKRGAIAIRQMLEAEVSDRNLDNQIRIKGTGCMKDCKAGPNLVMPDKTRHTKVRAGDIPQLLDQHLPSPSKSGRI